MNTYAKKFVVSFIAGAGSALGAAVTKSCWRLAEHKLKQNDAKQKAKNREIVVLEQGEGS